MGLWIPMFGGRVPDGAVAHGWEADGKPLYVARAYLNGGLHIGKVRGEFNAANIPYGGREEKVFNYEVFMGPGVWVFAEGGRIPMNAVAYGYEASGETLFAARAFLNGGLHPGKVRPAFGAANIPWGGAEVKVPRYEVLVLGS